MIPIKDLLNKLRWDKTEEQNNYIIGYEDRLLQNVIEIPFLSIKKIEDNFMVLEKDGGENYVPLHRIRIVKKKDEVVWQRKI